MSDFLNWELTNRMHNLGYDGKTLMYIDNEEDIINDDSAELIGAKPAILTSAAFRWFREKYGLVACNDYGNNEYFYWIVSKDEQIFFSIKDEEENTITYKSYEEAELECLVKLIDIVKEKQL